MIQLIEKRDSTFLIEIDGELYYFVPPSYLSATFFPIKAVVKGSTLGWNINGRFISYNKIKNAIKSP